LPSLRAIQNHQIRFRNRKLKLGADETFSDVQLQAIVNAKLYKIEIVVSNIFALLTVNDICELGVKTFTISMRNSFL